MGKGREYISFEIEYSYSIFLPALPRDLAPLESLLSFFLALLNNLNMILIRNSFSYFVGVSKVTVVIKLSNRRQFYLE